jgi:intracellular septation protein
MQLLLEYLPLAAFFVAYKLGGIYTATITLMVTMVASLGIQWLRTQKVTPMLGISTGLVLLFGTATLVLRSARFIQWKPTIFLWLVALAFLISSFVGKQPLAQRLLGPALGDPQLPRRDWLALNFAWVAFGILAGAANLYVAYNTSEATWVKIKVFGLTGLMMLFMVAQLFWLHARTKEPESHTSDVKPTL